MELDSLSGPKMNNTERQKRAKWRKRGREDEAKKQEKQTDIVGLRQRPPTVVIGKFIPCKHVGLPKSARLNPKILWEFCK